MDDDGDDPVAGSDSGSDVAGPVTVIQWIDVASSGNIGIMKQCFVLLNITFFNWMAVTVSIISSGWSAPAICVSKVRSAQAAIWGETMR